MTEVAWGEDPDGVVRTAVDGEGRVVAVSLDPHWRSTLADRELGPPVLAAVQAAGAARAAGRTERAPRGATPPEQAAQSLPPAMPRSPDEVTRWLSDLIHDVGSSLDDVRQAATRAATEEVEGRSACGRVTARARSGSLVSVECSHQLQRNGSRQQVERALTEALTGALPGQRHIQAAVRGTGRVGELLSLTADPARLLASLGLDSAAGGSPGRSGATTTGPGV